MAKATDFHPTIAKWVMGLRTWLTVLMGLFLFLLFLLFRHKNSDQTLSPFSYLLNMPANFSLISFNAQYDEEVAKFSNTTSSLSPSKSNNLNISSHMGSEVMTVSLWTHLEPIFNYSDLFPEAKQGAKEAKVAWMELLKEEKEEKSAYKSDRKNCPSSISALNGTSSEGILIPCGLIVDSSITIIGVLEGAEEEFAFELLGPIPPGEVDSPIVLHYNVRLQGDRATEEAVIVENSWSKDHGWAEEQRCPSPKDYNRKVDGLDVCAEQIGKSMIRKFPDLHYSLAAKWPPTIMKDETKHWFPFAKSSPFAATLWVGWEGFHMTVNGKHVTSFEYRQNLEPSIVSSLAFKGSLKPVMVVVNDLPTSEDITQIPDLEILKAPPFFSMTEKELFIGVFSTGNNFDQRMAVRRSWMQYDAVRSGAVVVRFFVGLHNKKQVNKEIWKEAATFGDIQLMPFVDYYNLISLKTIAICIFGTKMISSRYIMKTDDDTFVRIDEVLSSLRKTNHTRGHLYGSLEFDAKPHRDPSSKWFTSMEEWSGEFYPPFALGPGYIVSSDIARYIVLAHEERRLKLFKLEDVSMGMWIDEYKKQGHEIHYSNDNKFFNSGCKENYVVAHYQKPRHMTCLWQKLIHSSGPVCCDLS